MDDTAQTLTDQLHLTVDYGQSLEVMTTAGHYDWTNGDITVQRYPMEGASTVQVDAKLFQFDRNISSENVVEAIKTADPENPWVPAAIEHLLAFGASGPDEQRRYAIVALGSVAEIHGERFVPYLDVDDRSRLLNLYWWDDVWNGVVRFLAVRGLSSGA
jgi:hypothetical protein